MRRSVAILALLTVGWAGGASQSNPPAAVTEPHSGTSFPVSLIPPGGTVQHWLMGTAIRQRTIFRVQVYAFGLYVDPNAARVSLSRFTGASWPTLESDERFFRQLLKMEFAMTLRLVMTRTVSGDDIATAFDDELRPRLAAMGATTTARVALERFRAALDVDEVRAGTEIVFSCGPAGRLVSSVAGDERAAIDSPALCRALFDVYLGEDPISDEGKRRVIVGFPGLLR